MSRPHTTPASLHSNHSALGGVGSYAYACVRPESCNAMCISRYVQHGMTGFLSKIRTAATANHVELVACSEWALSLHHWDTVAPCTAPNALRIMCAQPCSVHPRHPASSMAHTDRLRTHSLSSTSCCHHTDRQISCSAGSVACLNWRVRTYVFTVLSRYDEQVNAFSSAQVANFMWGWRMPQGGSHEALWSMKYHLLGTH
jgi:hypothetical protein